jgi:hypothetical protein
MATDLSHRQNIRFIRANVRYVTRRAHEGEDFSSSLRRIIAEHEELSKANPRLETLTIEVTMKDRLDKLTTVIGLLVDRLDQVAADAARSRLVIENIQDYLAEEGSS